MARPHAAVTDSGGTPASPRGSPSSRPQSDLRSLRDSYDAVADAYDARYSAELDSKPLDRALLEAVAQLSASGTLADVGCGPGHVGSFLAGHHREVVGLDLALRMVQIARRRNPQQRFVVADMRHLPFEDNAWAGIVAFYSIIHLDAGQRHQAFAEFRRVLRDGGWLLLAFHIEDDDHRAGHVNHASRWLGQDVDIDGHFLDPDQITHQLLANDLHVTARLIREPDADVEYPSRRSYLLAQARSQP